MILYYFILECNMAWHQSILPLHFSWGKKIIKWKHMALKSAFDLMPGTLVSVLPNLCVVSLCDCTHLCYSHQRAESCLAQLMLLPCRHWAYREPGEPKPCRQESSALLREYSRAKQQSTTEFMSHSTPLHSHSQAFQVFLLCTESWMMSLIVGSCSLFIKPLREEWN